MNDSRNKELFLELRNRTIIKRTRTECKSPNPEVELSPNKTSTPNQSKSIEEIRGSIQATSQLLREVTNLIDKNTSVQNLTSLIPVSLDQSESRSKSKSTMAYNKEMADLMATNIPKFELSSTSSNNALALRTFIKSCENVLKLFDEEDEQSITEFFKLIRFRLGYDVEERITIEKFENLEQLESHLRSICHLKLNKGKLLNEIRQEKQGNDEDVSHFVERLRKLIAQGRSEYPKDREFENEAIHTLKNSIKNEFISFKLMDSDANKFEDLAEIAINRDCEIRQRNYKTRNTESSSDLINKLIQKIETLETKQTASIQHIRQEPRFRPTFGNRNRNFSRSPQRFNYYCQNCKRTGHTDKECRSKNFNQAQSNYNPNRSFNESNRFRQTQQAYRGNYNYQSNGYQNNPRQFSNSNQPFYNGESQENRRTPRQSSSSNQPFYNGESQESQRTPSYNNQTNPSQRTSSNLCVRCKKAGHSASDCYEIICSVCKQTGHSNVQCPQSTNQRRVHFMDSTCTCTVIPNVPNVCNHQAENNQGNE